MNDIVFHEGDNRIALRKMRERGEFVHAVATDPPYGLTSIIKRFGKADAAPALKKHTGGAFTRSSDRFIGENWDGNGIENDPDFWKLVLDVMLPGAMLIAFSSPRTYHMMATAIAAAGFIVHPMIGWAYGSGLAKPHSPKLDEWNGYSHGAQVLKPALEPIFVGQKPFSEKTCRANILKHGVGAVNIKDTRAPGGRWPANLITDGTLGEKFVVFETFPFEDKQVFYMPKADKSDRAGGSHPTVKPIALLQQFIRRITPPAGGIVLDPFAGSGTTGQAARNEGVSAVLMENHKDYAAFIRRRLKLKLTADDLIGDVPRKLSGDDLL